MDGQLYFSMLISFNELTDPEYKIKLGSGNMSDLNLIELDGHKEIKVVVKNEEMQDRWIKHEAEWCWVKHTCSKDMGGKTASQIGNCSQNM